ncbi:ABC transporter permease [Sphingobacterium sp. SGL-16]|uniref:ABC transporter permease n=1 Tax=Sphingobacterium litopenaei TaxID=2763500 RepID=A0ABR7YB67_9SPHI|nr:ABC transporter permease [Sphingobacterium litopenaei]NGM72869.1 ABC transporter permease [Sphingobacterium sp. SGL-16]
MNFPLFLANRINIKGQRTFSKLIVRVTIGALSIAIIAILLSVAILRGFKEEITTKQRGFFGDIVVTKQTLADYELMPVFLSDSQTTQILSIPNIESINGFATKVGIINVNSEVEGVMLKGVEPNYDQRFLKSSLVDGEILDLNAENAEQQLLVSYYLANRLNLKVGDDVIMSFVQENRTRKRKFLIKGIYRTNSDDWDKNYVVGSIEIIRKMNHLLVNETGAYEIRVKDFKQLEHSTEAVNEALPVSLKATNVIEYWADVFNWLEMLDMNDDIIFVLMVIVAVINMISSLLITILERTNMIGILKALGMNNTALRKVFMMNSLYIIGYGLLIGNVVAMVAYFFQRTTHFFKLDPSIYYLEFVPMHIDFLTVVILNISVIVLVFLTTIIPSMLITRISPIKTIQFK